MDVILGSVVKGFTLKETIKAHLVRQGHAVIDVGVRGTDSFAKYSAVGERVANALREKKGGMAVNICGTGTGAAIAAGKFRGIIAVVCESVTAARMIRVVNDANCLCLGEDMVTPEQACDMVDAFLSAEFQDAPAVPQPVLEFWAEARDEFMARGPEPRHRELEALD